MLVLSIREDGTHHETHAPHLGPLEPDSERYAFEVKWDGFRALVSTSRRGVTITSRNGNDMTPRYPELQGITRRDLLLDGEIVCLDDHGNPDFAALWFRSRGEQTPPVCFMAFDLLRHGSKDLTELTYSERRKRLEALDLNGSFVCTPPSYVGDGASPFEATRERGLEGVVAKRVDSRYRPGIRSKAWTKTKHMQTRTFALLGWVPPEEWRGDRGCVVVGSGAGKRSVTRGPSSPATDGI